MSSIRIGWWAKSLCPASLGLIRAEAPFSWLKDHIFHHTLPRMRRRELASVAFAGGLCGQADLLVSSERLMPCYFNAAYPTFQLQVMPEPFSAALAREVARPGNTAPPAASPARPRPHPHEGSPGTRNSNAWGLANMAGGGAAAEGAAVGLGTSPPGWCAPVGTGNGAPRLPEVPEHFWRTVAPDVHHEMLEYMYDYVSGRCDCGCVRQAWA